MVPLDAANDYTFFMDSNELSESVPKEAKVRLLRPSVPTSVAASASGNRSLFDMWRVARALSSHEIDVLLFPTIYSFVPTITRAKKIVVIHDVIAETYPDLTVPRRTARLLWNLKVSLGRRQADAIVTVSEYSRRCIVNRFGLPPDRVFVVSEASDPVFRPLKNAQITPALKAAGVPEGRPMIVYVGGFSPHKNLEVLIDAFSKLCGHATYADTVLVMVGEYRKEVFHSYYGTLAAQVQKLGLNGRVIFTGFLPDEELVVLLNMATVLALPSLMEGFGLPAVEAAACGCPVIATEESPLPELLEGGGIFIDPHKDHLDAALETVLGSQAVRERMRVAALHAASRLTWKAAAHQMMNVIRTVSRS
jgi:glycosyltransferase involved in cell wall biosynthesis